MASKQTTTPATLQTCDKCKKKWNKSCLIATAKCASPSCDASINASKTAVSYKCQTCNQSICNSLAYKCPSEQCIGSAKKLTKQCSLCMRYISCVNLAAHVVRCKEKYKNDEESSSSAPSTPQRPPVTPLEKESPKTTTTTVSTPKPATPKPATPAAPDDELEFASYEFPIVTVSINAVKWTGDDACTVTVNCPDFKQQAALNCFDVWYSKATCKPATVLVDSIWFNVKKEQVCFEVSKVSKDDASKGFEIILEDEQSQIIDFFAATVKPSDLKK